MTIKLYLIIVIHVIYVLMKEKLKKSNVVTVIFVQNVIY